MATETIAELEAILVPAEDFIPTQKSRAPLAKWALAIGTPPPAVYSMSLIDLTNLYHERGTSIKRDATELQRCAADIFLRTVEAIQSSKVDPDFMRDMIRLEIENLPTTRSAIRDAAQFMAMINHGSIISLIKIRSRFRFFQP